MTPIEAALLAAIIALPFHFAVQYCFARLEDPAYLRREGVVILKEDALAAHGGAIGTYRGHEVWANVTFMGMTYRFDRVARRSYRGRVGPRELYLDPGLVYRTD